MLCRILTFIFPTTVKDRDELPAASALDRFVSRVIYIGFVVRPLNSGKIISWLIVAIYWKKEDCFLS